MARKTERADRPMTDKDIEMLIDRLKNISHRRPYTVSEGGAGKTDFRRAARLLKTALCPSSESIG